jgi:hypothetical protein
VAATTGDRSQSDACFEFEFIPTDLLVVALLSGDGDQRQAFGAAGFRQREKEHDGRESAFGLPIAVVNP